LLQLSSFAQWLPTHAGLVKSIAVSFEAAFARLNLLHGRSWGQYLAAPAQMLQQDFQAAAMEPGALQLTVLKVPEESLPLPPSLPSLMMDLSTAPSPAGDKAMQTLQQWQQQCQRQLGQQHDQLLQQLEQQNQQLLLMKQQQYQPQQRRLCFSSFSSKVLLTPGLLAALPAHSTELTSSLTHLDLEWRHSTELTSRDVSAALKQLSRLQELRLSSGPCLTLPGSYLQVVAQLSQLTCLILEGNFSNVEKPLQQLLDQPPPLQQLWLCLTIAQHKSPVLDLAAMEQLAVFDTSMLLPAGSVLIMQLQQWRLGGIAPDASNMSTLLALKQLQQLSLCVNFAGSEPLLQLRQLPALTHLSLAYPVGICDTSMAAWPQLPQLRELSLGRGHCELEPNTQQMQAMLAGIAACSGLTKLELAVYEVSKQDEADDDVDDVRATVQGCGMLEASRPCRPAAPAHQLRQTDRLAKGRRHAGTHCTDGADSAGAAPPACSCG
jgi:hypothetical protein